MLLPDRIGRGKLVALSHKCLSALSGPAWPRDGAIPGKGGSGARETI